MSDETKHVPDGPDATRHVPDGPLTAKPTSGDLPSFGRFKTTAKLGEGAMGAVYRARDEMLGRDVAIKSLHADGDLGTRERFIREARAIGAVHHPNILAVHDVGESAGTPFLVMEVAAAGSLRDHIKAAPGAMPVDTVRDLGIQMARALAAAHAAGIIHRDVKPANILCAQPGTWKLADFGIAHVPDSTLTITGQFLGSPSYAAPESLRAGQFSPASDVYSLGATLYEALAGAPPHGNHDMQSLIRKLEQDAAPIHTRRPIPGPLGDAIMSALSRDPAQRPSADAFAERLAASSAAMVAAGSGVAAVPGAGAAVAGAAMVGGASNPRIAASSIPPGASLNHAAMPGAAFSPGASMNHAVPGTSLPGAAFSPGASMPPGAATATTATNPGTSRTMKLVALGLVAAAALAIVFALNNRPGPAHNLAPNTRPIESNTGGAGGAGGAAGDNNLQPGYGYDDSIQPPSAPGEPSAPGDPGAPMVVDQYGNPVDEETAKAILEQMERDARESAHPGRGRGKWKKRKGD